MQEELKQFIDKYKTIEAEIKLLQEDKKDLILAYKSFKEQFYKQRFLKNEVGIFSSDS